jgi:hypothetical protein
MKKCNFISKFKALTSSYTSIQATILIGSFGRNTPKPNSDLDFQLLVTGDFDNDYFHEIVKQSLGSDFKYVIYLPEKNKWCFYLGDEYTLLEVFICYELSELDKYYLGSEIENPKTAIIFDKTETVNPYLTKITADKKAQRPTLQKEKIEKLIRDFQNHFEALSSAHARSDGYKFSVLYFHALNAVVRLIYLCEGGRHFDYMPPNFLTDYSYKLKLGIEQLGTADLRQANTHNRKLLDLFNQYLPIAVQKYDLKIEELPIVTFLENIFQRDYFWNFRDASKFNSKLKKGILFRTSSLTNYQNELFFKSFFKEKNITEVIDLRADREVAENSYSLDSQELFKYVHAPFDPWAQSIDFQNTYNTGSNAEIAYHFFMLECKVFMQKVMTSVLNNENATAIHCHAGKDRTGIIFTLLHLVTGASEESIMDDYLASEMDSNLGLLAIILKTVEQFGNAEGYLISCGLTKEQIELLKEN